LDEQRRVELERQQFIEKLTSEKSQMAQDLKAESAARIEDRKNLESEAKTRQQAARAESETLQQKFKAVEAQIQADAVLKKTAQAKADGLAAEKLKLEETVGTLETTLQVEQQKTQEFLPKNNPAYLELPFGGKTCDQFEIIPIRTTQEGGPTNKAV
jgi:hypothetical protein